MSESQLVFQIMQTLGRYGYVVRCNCGSVPLANGIRFYGLPQGWADIMFIRPDGRVCFVEVKSPTGKLSEAQERFIERMKSLNCRAGVAYSIDDALAIAGLTDEGGTA